jgi:hypothetical protein
MEWQALKILKKNDNPARAAQGLGHSPTIPDLFSGSQLNRNGFSIAIVIADFFLKTVQVGEKPEPWQLML